MRKLIRGERHHWWPMSLSKYWTNQNGKIGRLTPDGNSTFVSPKKIARISDGHNILFGEPSPWDGTFEGDFDAVDSAFPTLVDWLGTLTQQHADGGLTDSSNNYRYHHVEDEELSQLTACLTSLVVRSPQYRSAMSSIVEYVRGPVGKKEMKQLMASNLQHKQNGFAKSLGHRGKFVILFSQESEFVFGDGFYNNFPTDYLHFSAARVLVPITPSIAVLFTQPMQYRPAPRLMTHQVERNQVQAINETVQIYSKDCIVFGTDKPELSEHFARSEHLEYNEGDPVRGWISDIPGVIEPRGSFGCR